MKFATILECALVGLGTAMVGIPFYDPKFWVIIGINGCIVFMLNMAVNK